MLSWAVSFIPDNDINAHVHAGQREIAPIHVMTASAVMASPFS